MLSVPGLLPETSSISEKVTSTLCASQVATETEPGSHSTRNPQETRTMKLAARFLQTGAIAALLTSRAATLMAGQTAPQNKERTPTPPLHVILDAWKSRQERIEAFDFSCAGIEFRSKRLAVGFLQTLGKQPEDYVELNDATFKVRIRFTVDRRGRVRMEYDGRVWSTREHKYVSSHGIDEFNGKVSESFFPVGPSGFPGAHISRGSAAEIARDARILPIRLVYRPIDTVMGVVNPQLLVVTNEREIVNARPCIILKSTRERIWVDPERDFVPVRYSRTRRGTIDRTIEIAYARNDQNGWVPKEWTNVRFEPKGNTLDSMTLRVTEFTINKDIPDSLFKNEYPVGTWVHNYITDEEYIVREGGAKRPIRPGEYDGTNYEELRDSEPPESGKSRFWKYIIIANLAALIVVVLAFIYFRRKKARQSTTGPNELPESDDTSHGK